MIHNDSFNLFTVLKENYLRMNLELEFLEKNRIKLKKRKILAPLVNPNEDFTPVNAIYKKFNNLRNKLLHEQKQLR